MLHELLMALNGYPGTIFYDTTEGIKVSSNIPNLHPAEKTNLERLCILGTKYKFLAEFIKAYRIHQAKNDIYGLYLESFCNGLDSVLNIYRNDLLNLEEELLNDPFLPLTHFLKLEQYILLFQLLSKIIAEIKSEKVHGCQILDVIYQHSNSGMDLIEKSMHKILQHCHPVMFNQVFSWMMHGFIEDPYNEFFIQSNDSVSLHKDLFAKRHQKISPELKYHVKADMLPSYIPCSLAAKILFVGEYISVLGATEDSDAYLLFLKKENIFAKKIEKHLESHKFSLLSFESTIDDIRKCAAEHLWQVITKGANVVHHFKIIKDFYLLGRGELFLDFIGEANQLLRMPVTTTAENDVNKLFQAVARQIFPDEDSITDKFHVTLLEKKRPDGTSRENISKAKLETGWSSIGLLYDVPNPLHILITPIILERYDVVFRFLLSVRKVQIELHQCWGHQMLNKRGNRQKFFVLLWKLRSDMSFLVDNFQYYVLVDVLESCFKTFLEKMENVKDFEEIQQYHDAFISSIISQCFLELPIVFSPLNDILETCTAFCGLINRINLVISQRDISQFENLKLSFERQTALLFRILSGVKSHQVSPHLARLLLRIDYNKYLSSCGGQLGGTQTF